jgi:signal transduction histidine kinase
MSLLITLIMDSMLALEAGGATEADTRHLLDAQHKDMRQLNGLVGTLLLLVDDFLFFSKIRQSPDSVPPAAPVAFKLSVLLEEVGFVAAPLAGQKHLGFTMQCDGLDEVLVGPAKDLKRILQNLVSNAIHYTTAGSVTLSAKRIESDGGAPDDPDVVHVKFQVQDTGAGMSTSEQSKLWQPYVRGGTAPTHSLSFKIVVRSPLFAFSVLYD